MIEIAVYVPQNAAIEAITPAYRAFTTANEFLLASGKPPLFKVEYVGLQKSVAANNGEYLIKMHRSIEEVQRPHLIIIPALFGDVREAITANAKAIPWIIAQHAKGTAIASLCIGAFLLAETGLVDGRQCSTHWAYFNEFKEMYPQVALVDGAIITEENNIYTSGGANSCWNLILYLLEKYTNRDIAILAAKYFAIDIDRDNQNMFTIFKGQKHHNDNDILKAQEYIEKNYTEKLSIEQLADNIPTSRRSFERRFKQATGNTFVNYLQRVRIEVAKRDFEASRKNVAEVMYDVGYTDTKAFRDVFKKVTGLTPVEYRSKYCKN